MNKITKNDILKILIEVSSEIDWDHETHLISERVLDSLMLVSTIELLSAAYGVEFDFEMITPNNMDSLDSITELVNRLL